MTVTDELWGTTLTAIHLDLLAGSVEIDTTRTAGTSEEAVLRRLTCSGVSRFQLLNEVPVPWTYAQLTECHIETAPGVVRVVITLWDEPTGIVIECEDFAVTER